MPAGACKSTHARRPIARPHIVDYQVVRTDLRSDHLARTIWANSFIFLLLSYILYSFGLRSRGRSGAKTLDQRCDALKDRLKPL